MFSRKIARVWAALCITVPPVKTVGQIIISLEATDNLQITYRIVLTVLAALGRCHISRTVKKPVKVEVQYQIRVKRLSNN